jgi:HEPN domain-containing protein
MQPDRSWEGNRWFKQAARDLEDARFCSSGGRFHLACFLAQQAAEKALKAFLYWSGEDDPWGHSVAELCRAAGSLDPEFAAILGDAAPLDRFCIPTRYPNGLPGGIPSEAFSASDAAGALELAEKVIWLVETKRPGSDI